MTADPVLGHFRDVCHALAFAPSRGIIHRDVKPADVRVGEFAETVLLDWGIAKIRGTDDLRGQELERRRDESARPRGLRRDDGRRHLADPARRELERTLGH